MVKHILIVDDDALVRRSLAFNLEQAGYKASNAEKAEDALAMARVDRPDLVLLDIGLPGMDGLDALHQFKEQLNLPVIFLTARRRELDEALGLELGADDYITKPFDLNVLLARVKNVLRHIEHPTVSVDDQASIILDDITINPSAHTVMLGDQPVELTPREFDLLHAFALQPNKVLSVDELLASVWGAEFIGQPQVVYVHIRWLREKIEKDPNNPELIVTVRGVGYKLIQQEG
ncbi:MAG: response regulator transcription factor [Anaerolineales bacterium]|jgi:DNA-binding response OmpR family regulator